MLRYLNASPKVVNHHNCSLECICQTIPRDCLRAMEYSRIKDGVCHKPYPYVYDNVLGYEQK